MNILLINHYAGSSKMGMEFRPYYFAREWIKKGHRVDIIAADYSHLRRVNPEVNKDFQEDIIDGIHYHWIKTGLYEGNGVKRAITMFKFVVKLWLHTDKIIRDMQPDVVICSSTYPLDTYVGQRIRKKSDKKVKLIHEVHDMWPATLVEMYGMSKNHPFIKLLQYGENSFCKNSDLVASLLPAADDYLYRHGMRKDKFVHISNGVLLEEWENPMPLPKEHSAVLGKLKKEGKFIICFFGSHTKSYSLDILIKAIQEIDRDDIAVVFIGDGFFKDDLIKMAGDNKDRFIFLPPIPKSSIPSLFGKIDATYVAAINTEVAKYGICMNKLFDSMMGGRPILYAVNAPNNYIEKYHCGISVEAENIEALKKGIYKLLSCSDEEKHEMGQNGKNAALKYFNYSSLSKKFVDIMKNEDWL